MNSLAVLFLPAALLAAPADAPHEADTPALAPEQDANGAIATPSRLAPVWTDLVTSFQPMEQDQVRIERRVIIRINPRRNKMAPDMLSALPQGELPPQFEERKFGKCVPAKAIAGVQAQPDNRLLLFLRDRRMITVKLEKSCRARDFYSGFYVEANEDGLVCSGRDKLHSRSGANCDLGKMRQLVAERR
ncbi:MAG: hypothetical protein E6R00_03765 [Gammaproteobacteria bacterium]|nr:MAG: hypothetical protein E6R00_03765 [Gammaproteobacteria bacterium]